MAEITVTINIDEKEIQKLVTQQIADAMTSEYGSTVRDTKYGVRKGVEMAVKNTFTAIRTTSLRGAWNELRTGWFARGYLSCLRRWERR